MANLLNQVNITLMKRLSQHVGLSVRLKAEGALSEPGLLEHVGKQFIRVRGQYVVPSSMHQISLLGVGIKPDFRGPSMRVRTIADGSFPTKISCTGEDFIEAIIEQDDKIELILIPLNKIISLEGA